MATTSRAPDLIRHVRESYKMACQEISSNPRKQLPPDNGLTDYAIPPYVLSVAAIDLLLVENLSSNEVAGKDGMNVLSVVFSF